MFRVATHELGGIHLLAEMEWKYSTKQLFDMLEVMDTHDAYKKIAYDNALAEAKNNQKTK